MAYRVAGCLFWGIFGFILFAIRPGALLHRLRLDWAKRGQRAAILLSAAAIILLCTLPMGLSPFWKGSWHLAMQDKFPEKMPAAAI